jgi:peptidyl-prolyl cis-trans isomerase D
MAKATARHILVDNENTCNELKTQIENGTDFAEVARQHSSCPSGAQGGELGEFGPGQMVREFDEVVFSGELNTVHGPVKTQFGYHVIKLEDIQPAKTQTLEEATTTITSTLRNQESKKLARQLATAAYEGIIGAGSLASYAEANKEQELVETDYFDRSTPPIEIVNDSTFLDKAFNLKAGELSSIVESNRGFFILFAEDIKAPETPPFDQVKEKVTTDFKAQKAAEKADEVAAQLLERIKGGEPMDDVAKEYGLTTADSGFIGRSGQPTSEFPPSLIELVFKLSSSEPFPESAGTVGESYYVYRFKDREVPEIKEDTDLERYEQMLLSAKQQEILGAYLKNLEKKATITRHTSL